ncbi:MAG: hypothetical protein K2W95_19595 [Candidatus Obscuribacterales bacterium]|nr:hypothetical protein [Candidatus Obscuribacterales bacterium]
MSFAHINKRATDTTSPIVNGQSPGIGRIKRLNDLLVINNLGKNIEFKLVDGDRLVPSGIFARSEYRNGTEATEYDLDIHGAVSLDGRLLLMNHLGTLVDIDAASYRERGRLHWIGDAECLELIGDRLISTSGRGDKVADPVTPGIIVSEKVPPSIRDRKQAIERHVLLEDWGITAALSVSPRDKIAFGATERIACFALGTRDGKPTLSSVWFADASFAPSWSTFTADSKFIIFAGYAPDSYKSDYDWNSLRGGFIAMYDAESGEPVWQTAITVNVAWGNGGVPIVLHEQLGCIAAVDRQAALHYWHLYSGTYAGSVKAPENNDESYGIGHAAIAGRSVVCGFNRAGYQLFQYTP